MPVHTSLVNFTDAGRASYALCRHCSHCYTKARMTRHENLCEKTSSQLLSPSHTQGSATPRHYCSSCQQAPAVAAQPRVYPWCQLLVCHGAPCCCYNTRKPRRHDATEPCCPVTHAAVSTYEQF